MRRRTPAIEDTIIDGISRGITLRELCRDQKIRFSTVYRWMEDDAFAARMARARALGFDALVDEMIEIADDSRNDWLERKDAKADAPPQRNPENVARSRLRIETRMRILARWYPLRFGGMDGRIGGMAGLTAIGSTGARAGVPAPGAAAAAAAVDTTAIAVRLSSILATIAARDSAGESIDGDGADAPGWDDASIIEHDDIAPEDDA